MVDVGVAYRITHVIILNMNSKLTELTQVKYAKIMVGYSRETSACHLDLDEIVLIEKVGRCDDGYGDDTTLTLKNGKVIKVNEPLNL